jgi:hypothetical protein
MMILILYLQVFEYAEDLEYYWIDGYGYNITYRQACPPVKDMMQHFLWVFEIGFANDRHLSVGNKRLEYEL